MYEHQETIIAVPAGSTLVTLTHSLPAAQQSLYESIVNDNFAGKALVFSATHPDPSTLIIISQWPSKADYQAAVAAIDSALSAQLGITPDAYYSNPAKFQVSVSEQTT